MRRPTRSLWMATLVILTGCSSVRIIPIADVTSPPAVTDTATTATSRKPDAFHSKSGQQIKSYVTRDSVRHAFDGYAHVHGDSIRFENLPPSGWNTGRPKPTVVIELHRDQVLSVEAVRSNTGSTVALSVALAVMVLAGIGWATSGGVPNESGSYL
ncbi:MAG: hypothetical protein ACHQ52_02215 [Candidatus Eisenbacteria bacterium]